MIGSMLGRYRIVEEIGGGAMGIVYRAHDPTLDRDVAIKLLHDEALEDDASSKRFVGEALALSRLNHPHICTIHEIGVADGRTYIVMEYVKGRPLYSMIPPGGLPFDTVLRYGSQIAAALAHSHRHGIVHRDLKSGNVVITPDGNAKVLDFGLARRVHAEQDAALTQSAPTRAGMAVGTPAYIAPEVWTGAPADVRSDVWALGVLLYEMAAGERPFRGRTAIEIASATIKEAPAPLPERMPAALRGIIHRCLTREPDRRYQSASEVQAALDAVGSGELSAVIPAHRRTRALRLWAAAAGVAVMAAVLALVIAAARWRPEPASVPIQSIAVLPLDNLSGDPEQEYFADGMTEQLLSDLSKIGGLRVISRTSVMQYKSARRSLQEIARELGVDAVVEGSVVEAGGRVRITARLIRAATDENVWAESYERDSHDVLALQGEVARRIAREIDVALTTQQEAGLVSRRRIDPAVHRQFLLGRFHLNRGTEDGIRRAIEYFESAVAADPDYAEGHAALAEAYVALASDSLEAPRNVIPTARAAAQTALRLDDSLAAAHAALGFIHLFYDFDGPAAARALNRAIELNPSLALAHLYQAGHFLAVGRADEAVPEIRAALELDPLSLRTHAVGTIFLIFARRYDEAIEQARRALELEPEFGIAFAFQSLAYAESGRLAEAVTAMQTALEHDRSWRVLLFAAHIHAVAGDADEAERLIAEATHEGQPGYICPYEIATAYVSLRDHDEAYKWFKKGVDDRADCMAWLGVEPWIEPFRSDARYAELIRAVGLAAGAHNPAQ